MASRPNRKPAVTQRPRFIVSACLAGVDCAYDGGSRLIPYIKTMVDGGLAIPVCPEMLGGSRAPRERCEISGGDGRDVLSCKASVMTVSGRNISARMISGARKTLSISKRLGIREAIMKSGSPSCGRGKIYDGSFTGQFRKGDGVTTALLLKNGVKVYNEAERRLWRAGSVI